MRGQYMRGQKTKQKREISEVKINAENIKKAQPILIFAEKQDGKTDFCTYANGRPVSCSN